MAKNSRKESRKELLKEEDAFLKVANDSAKWVDSHKALVFLAIALVVGGILGVWGSVEYLRSRDALASELYRQATLAVNATVLAEDSEEAAEPWGDPPTFESKEVKLKEAKSRFERVVNETSGSPAGVLARFFIADIEEQMGDLEAAEKSFGALATDLGSTDALYFFAVERQAYLQEKRGATDDAIATWAPAASSTKGYLIDRAVYQQARLYLEKGEKERARNLLERLTSDFPNTSIAAEVKDLQERIAPAVAETPEVKAAQPSPEATADQEEAKAPEVKAEEPPVEEAKAPEAEVKAEEKPAAQPSPEATADQEEAKAPEAEVKAEEKTAEATK